MTSNQRLYLLSLLGVVGVASASWGEGSCSGGNVGAVDGIPVCNGSKSSQYQFTQQELTLMSGRLNYLPPSHYKGITRIISEPADGVTASGGQAQLNADGTLVIYLDSRDTQQGKGIPVQQGTPAKKVAPLQPVVPQQPGLPYGILQGKGITVPAQPTHPVYPAFPAQKIEQAVNALLTGVGLNVYQSGLLSADDIAMLGVRDARDFANNYYSNWALFGPEINMLDGFYDALHNKGGNFAASMIMASLFVKPGTHVITSFEGPLFRLAHLHTPRGQASQITYGIEGNLVNFHFPGYGTYAMELSPGNQITAVLDPAQGTHLTNLQTPVTLPQSVIKALGLPTIIPFQQEPVFIKQQQEPVFIRQKQEPVFIKQQQEPVFIRQKQEPVYHRTQQQQLSPASKGGSPVVNVVSPRSPTYFKTLTMKDALNDKNAIVNDIQSPNSPLPVGALALPNGDFRVVPAAGPGQ